MKAAVVGRQFQDGAVTLYGYYTTGCGHFERWSMTMKKPKVLGPIFENIPQSLKDREHWVLWRLIEKDGRWTKIPYQKNGKPAKSNDPATWLPFDECMKTYITGGLAGRFDGVGVMVRDDLVGVDVDHCIDDGTLSPEALEIVTTVDSYTETSPSGNGIRIFCTGIKPGDRFRAGNCEMYDNTTNRFLTVTGHKWEGMPAEMEERTAEIAKVYYKYIEPPKPKQEPRAQGVTTKSDREIIEAIRRGNQAGKFNSLYDGDVSGYPSQSEADQALSNILAFHADKDPEAIDRIFRTSGLYREKWERDDYRTKTIQTAIDGTADRRPVGNFENVDIPAGRQHPAPPPEPVRDLMAIDEYIKNLFASEMLANKNAPRLHTGFRELDEWLNGGLYPGLHVLAGETGTGKTSFALQLADTFAQQDVPVLFIGLEMGRFELVSRSITRLMMADGERQFTTGHVLNGNIEADIVGPYVERYADKIGHNLFIESAAFGLTVNDAVDLAEQVKQKTGKAPAVFVDYIQIIKKIDERATDLSAIDTNVKTLKCLSVNLNMPVVVLSAVNRDSYTDGSTSKKENNLKAFKGSGTIEFSGDTLLMLDTDDADQDEQREVTFTLQKNRRGKRGKKLKTRYYPAYNLFEPMKV